MPMRLLHHPALCTQKSIADHVYKALLQERFVAWSKGQSTVL